MYNTEYFIKKFEVIPEDNWCIGQYRDRQRYCTLGLCGYIYDPIKQNLIETEEGQALCKLFFKHGLIVVVVSDGYHDDFDQNTPKQRILAALRYIQHRENGTYSITI